MPTKPTRIFALAAGGLLLAALACGFAYITNSSTKLPLRWPAGNINMRIMVDNTVPLSDGLTRATSIQAAMTDGTRGWNHNLGDAQFAPQILAVGSGADGNSINEIFFSSAPYSMSWDTNTLAVTTDWYVSNQRVEADMIFNQAYTWDSYRGANKGSPVDIQRVALHELGHVLGLDHPDEAGQTVTAIMNSHVSSIDSLQADDITGAQNLYGPVGIPANDGFAAAVNIVLSGTSATLSGYNTNATKEAGEPNHAGNGGGRSVWWKWTAPGPGSVTLSTQGSVFDTTLGVYTGTAVSALTLVGSSDDVQAGVVQYSLVSFTAAGGTTYYFAVDGFNGSDGHGADSGAVTLNLSFAPSGSTSTTSTTIASSSSTIATTSTTVPPTSGGGGGGGGGAPSEWFFGALGLLACARWLFSKKD
jgi:hypothetical protein